jgi:hypothetical protein
MPVEQTSDACKEFLKALHQAELAGGTTSTFELGKKVFGDAVESGVVLAVFDKCKKRGWVLGTVDAAWITPSGKKAITKP